MKIISCLLLAFTFFGILRAQDANWCGFQASPEDIAEHLMLQKEIAEFINSENTSLRQRSIISIPVKAHVFRRDDGTWRSDSARIKLSLEKANEWLALNNVGIELYLCGNINYIDNTKLYNELATGNIAYDSNNWWFSKIKVPYAINMLVASWFDLDGYKRAGMAFPPIWDARGTFAIADTAEEPYKIITHEIGHLLGLYHTFGTTNDCLTGTDELVNGSNCKYAGDYICDTKATPCLSSLVNADCVYTGRGKDANGQSFTPDITNIMSYARYSCISTFTPEQAAVMRFYAKKYFQFSGDCASSGNYCTVKGENTSYGYINEIAVGSKRFVSGNNNGYRHHNNTGIVLEKGNSQAFVLRSAGGCPNHVYKWRIFIDLNQDKDFEDAGELIYDSFEFPMYYPNTPPNMQNARGQLWVPPYAKTGQTRMRIACKYTGLYPSSVRRISPMPCENLPFGEMEDFDIEIKEPTIPDPYCSAYATRCLTQQPCENGYADRRHLVIPVYQGASLGTSFENFYGYRYIAADWNQDGQFDNVDFNELYNKDENVTVPPTALLGKTRVRSTLDGNNCSLSLENTVTDYTVYVFPQSFNPPVTSRYFELNAAAGRIRIPITLKAGDIVTRLQLASNNYSLLGSLRTAHEIVAPWASMSPLGILEKNADTLTVEYDANYGVRRELYIYHYSSAQNKISRIVLNQAAAARYLNVLPDTLFLPAGKDTWMDTTFRIRTNSQFRFSWYRNCDTKPLETPLKWLSTGYYDPYYGDTTTFSINNLPDPCTNGITFKYQPNTSSTKRSQKLFFCGSSGNLDSLVVVQAGRTITAVKDLVERGGIKIFPNPSNEFFKVSSQAGIIKRAILTNLSGQIQRIHAPNADSYTLENIPAGVYFLRILTESGWYVQKLMAF